MLYITYYTYYKKNNTYRKELCLIKHVYLYNYYVHLQKLN